jgi:beta-xylosidase
MRRQDLGNVVVLPRDNNLVDVFTGTGWTRHTVFEVNGPNQIKFVKGFALTQAEFQEFKKTL